MNRIQTFRFPFSYYKLLNVARDATHEEIKRSYFSLAKLHHPDVGKISVEEFLKISQAYEVLKNPISRQEYDREHFSSTYQHNGYSYYGDRYETSRDHVENDGVGKAVFTSLQLLFCFLMGYAFYHYYEPMTEHEIRRQNIMLANENIDSSPSAQEKRRKQYAKQMIDKKITSNVKILTVRDGSAKSTKSKKHDKMSIESIAGVKKQIQAQEDLRGKTQYM